MKETYDYEVKTKVREAIRKSIKCVFNMEENRRGLKVLTLLGHEDLELNQIWDPLSIPRSRITNVERDKRVLDLAGERKVKNIHGDLEEVIKTIKGPFDIISLDTVSPFTKEQREILRYISGRQLLSEKGILVTNYLGQREAGYNKHWFLHARNEHLDGVEELKDVPENKIIGRSDLISRMINSIMLDGTTNIKPHPLVQNDPKYEAMIVSYLEKTLGFDWKNKLGPTGINGVHKTYGYQIVKKNIDAIVSMSYLAKKYPPDAIKLVSEMLYYQDIGAYFSVDQKRFRYVGDGGSPMFVDVNYLKHLPLSEVIKIEPVFGGFKISEPEIKKIGKLHTTTNLFLRGRERCFYNGQSPREYLGSSYRKQLPQEETTTEREKLTKENAIYLLREGIPSEEILETYPEFSKRQLAAFKAHITMGSYGEK